MTTNNTVTIVPHLPPSISCRHAAFTSSGKKRNKLKKGDCRCCKYEKTGLINGMCQYCGINSANWEPKAKIINMTRVMALMEKYMTCERCGAETFGSGRILMINEDATGREFVPFHIICSCGHEVKVYE